MDILRRAATGRLAKMLGPDYLLMDEVVRRDGFTAAEQARFFRRLTARDRRALEAFRDGVNAFIAAIAAEPQRVPVEFGGVPPTPWTIEDSVAVAVLELLVEGANGGQEVLQANLVLDLLDRFPESEARGIFDDLLWIDEPAAPTTIAAEDARSLRANRDRIRRFAPRQLDLVRTHATAIRHAAAALQREQGLMGGLGRQPPFPLGLHRHASNAIVVGPAFSATRHPILLGGPQTGRNAPSFFWEVGLHDGSYEAEGVTAPSGPGVLIGRGRHFAMTLTSGIDDGVDTYTELLDPRDPGRYRFQGRWRRFTRRSETFQVNGQSDVTLEVLRSVHGPVFFLDRADGVAFSRRAAFRGRELDSAAAVLNLGRVRNLGDFRRLADRMAMSFNFHYADDVGNIAYFHRGMLPRRPLHTDPRLPLDGRGAQEWRGIDPPRKLPAVVNPRRGFIANWNNKPVPGWSAGEQRELWGVADRVEGLTDALDAARASGAKLSVADVKALMRHAAVADVFAARILPFLEDAMTTLPEAPKNAPLRDAVGRVRAWVDAGASLVAAPDGHGAVPDPGAAIYTAFRTTAQAAIFDDELASAGRAMYFPDVLVGDQQDDHSSFGTPDALLLRVLFASGPVAGATTPDGVLPVSRLLRRRPGRRLADAGRRPDGRPPYRARDARRTLRHAGPITLAAARAPRDLSRHRDHLHGIRSHRDGARESRLVQSRGGSGTAGAGGDHRPARRIRQLHRRRHWPRAAASPGPARALRGVRLSAPTVRATGARAAGHRGVDPDRPPRPLVGGHAARNWKERNRSLTAARIDSCAHDTLRWTDQLHAVALSTRSRALPSRFRKRRQARATGAIPVGFSVEQGGIMNRIRSLSLGVALALAFAGMAAAQPAAADPTLVVGDKVTVADKAMGDLASAYWVAFGKTGDPNGGGRPQWPRHDPAVDTVIGFTNTGVAVAPDPIKARLDLWQKAWEHPTH